MVEKLQRDPTETEAETETERVGLEGPEGEHNS